MENNNSLWRPLKKGKAVSRRRRLLIKMLKHALAEVMAQNSNKISKQLGINLNRNLNDKLSKIETTSIFSSSLLDPRFKTLQRPANAESAVYRSKSEFAALLRNMSQKEEPPSTSRAHPEPAASSKGKK